MERISMLLDNKNAVIYGAGGAIGGAVARTFAREGSNVHLAGRTLQSLQEVAQQIRSAGGVAHTAQLDALEEQAVDQHADAVAEKAGSIDISFNLISLDPGESRWAGGHNRNDRWTDDGGGQRRLRMWAMWLLSLPQIMPAP
jgi:NADP-dependent 3-hydroxy acid dehydrogenase YdfG